MDEPIAVPRRFDRSGFLVGTQSWTLVLNVLLPMAVFLAAWAWDSGRISRPFSAAIEANVKLALSIGLAIASVVDGPALFLVRRQMKVRALALDGEAQRRPLTALVLVVSVVSATPALYALVLALLACPMWSVSVCVAFSLLYFRLFRVRDEEFPRSA